MKLPYDLLEKVLIHSVWFRRGFGCIAICNWADLYAHLEYFFVLYFFTAFDLNNGIGKFQTQQNL